MSEQGVDSWHKPCGQLVCLLGKYDDVPEEDGSEPTEHRLARLAEPGERLDVALAANQVKHLQRQRPVDRCDREV